MWSLVQADLWLPHCLRQVRYSYGVFISQDLPGQVTAGLYG